MYNLKVFLNFLYPLIASSGLLATEIPADSLMSIDTLSDLRQERLSLKDAASWKGDLKNAFEEASNSGKVLLVALLGGKSCPWTEKFISEILTQKDFLYPLENEVVFYRCENLFFEAKKAGLSTYSEVKELPAILLFSAEGKEISRIGYLPYEPKVFAKRLSSIIKGYHELSNKLTTENTKEIDDKDLESMYASAKDMGCIGLKDKLFEMGRQRNKNVFFLLEQYNQLLSIGKKKDKATKSLKQTIQKLDPKNSRGALRKIAVLDFEESIRNNKKSNNPFAVIKPLLEYMKNYGDTDKENSWQIEMMMAEYLFSKNQLPAALHHAETSYKMAPESAKGEVQEALDYLRAKCTK